MKRIERLEPNDLRSLLDRLFELAASKTSRLARRWDPAAGAPVVTAAGRYVGRNWTQWTEGFAYGNALLCYELTGDKDLLKYGRDRTLERMTPHVTHTGVHDHGFNNLPTFGALRRLTLEGKLDGDDGDLRYYELALKTSGAIQAARWTDLPDDLGFIHSFNGPHSLFIDTIRTIRICGVAHSLGHVLLGEQDRRYDLLSRLLKHAKTSAAYNIFYGEGRDSYDRPDLRGRTAHEAIFNPVSGTFRCPSTQQGYSPFSTWTRGLAWAMLGFAEQLEFLNSLPESDFDAANVLSKPEAVSLMETTARAVCDFYLHQGSSADGICYWDTGAPDLHRLGDWRAAPADPYNRFEPVDASASAIAAQGLLRLGRALGAEGSTYYQAGLGVAKTLLTKPYLSTDPEHEGILLHSIYHRPNGWDYIAEGAMIPYGESSMWGDYHMLELGLLISRLAENKYYTFFQ